MLNQIKLKKFIIYKINASFGIKNEIHMILAQYININN